MDLSRVDKLSQIHRSYDLLVQAAALLERAGEDDVAAFLYTPLGLMEERFDLAPPSTRKESQSNS